MGASGERIAPANGIEIAYEDMGDPNGSPLVLVMGLAMQMIWWDEGFIGLLGERGHRVIRFDNRDVGHSTRIDAPVPGHIAMLAGTRRNAAYVLADMADDTAGLLDHLGIDSAHVAGISMGGMISQQIALRHPKRVRSLSLISTSPGKWLLSLPRWRAFSTLFVRRAGSREQYVEQLSRAFRVIGSPGYEQPEDEFRRRAAAAYDRAHCPDGAARQMHAITASSDRTRRLGSLRVPTAVIHGDSDPLVRPVNGRALARAIPEAELTVLPGMGHDLPPQLWPEITATIAANAERAEPGRVDRPAAAVGAR